MTLMALKDRMAKELYGRTLTEAWADRVCVCHGEPIDEMNLSDRDAREYKISGLCPRGWEEMAASLTE